MLKLYYYLINYKHQSVANIFKTVDTMQKLTQNRHQQPQKQKETLKKEGKQKLVA